MTALDIAWPGELQTSHAYVHAHNETILPATADVCFAWLCRAALWPTWYSNCSKFKFERATDTLLKLGTAFSWVTFHMPVHSTVRRYEPPLHLEWDATAPGIRAYHAWLIVPQGDHCLVITEENQIGPVPFLLRGYLTGMMERGHQTWLAGLRTVTASGRLPE